MRTPWQKLTAGDLESLSEEEFEELATQVAEAPEDLRLRVMAELERVSNPEVLATLVALYGDPLPEIRERALTCTYRLGGDTLAEEEIGALLTGDAVPAVRAAAALALGVTRTATARALLEEALEDEDADVRAKVKGQLQLLG